MTATKSMPNGSEQSLIEFFWSQRDALVARTLEHLNLTAITLVCSLLLGMMLASFVYRHRTLRNGLVALASIVQTIPSIALLVLAITIFGEIGYLPALIALIFYALLPIVQNTLIGLDALSPSLSEAARSIGLTRLQHLLFIRLPLAIPAIMAGVRIAAVQTVGLATLAAFVGAGGLGQFINRGLFLSDSRLILLGAIPAAFMALAFGGLLSMITRALTPHYPLIKRRIFLGISLMIIISTTLGMAVYMQEQHTDKPASSIAIGSKNFTEQLIVAEMVAQHIEQHTDLSVQRRFGLGGSAVMHKAIHNGEIDIAVEYTGTALTSILQLPAPHNPDDVFYMVKQNYAQLYNIAWLDPLGFDNSYRLAVRNSDKRLDNVTNISALIPHAPSLNAAFDFEFAEREDGYKGLKSTYGLTFANTVDMHPDLLYPALFKGSVDVISAYTTDGRIDSFGFRVLHDDRHFFPPYEAAIMIRDQATQAYPMLKPLLSELSYTLDDDVMRRMNAQVDSKKMTVEQVASELLRRAIQKRRLSSNHHNNGL